ncbi:MAG: proline--tRNA ligase [Nanoarchaeota archaeon]
MALKNKKAENFSEWYTEITGENGAKLVDMRYGVQGFVPHRPWAVRITRNFEALLETAVEKDNYDPILLPVLISEENIKKEKEHVQFSPELFWVERMGNSKLEVPLYLRPTGESQIYPLYSLWIRSWKDLPWKNYQSRIMTYRGEPTTRPFLRGREFMFFETHGVFTTHKEVLEQIDKDMEIASNVITGYLGLPFLFFKRPNWDKFAGADDTYAADCIMPDGKVNQIASTHDLGQRFSKAYDIKFVNKKEQQEFGWQTCFGPGIWRIMAALIAVHGDDYGLVLPFKIAPIQIAIVPIIFEKGDKKIDKKCKELEKKLSKNFRVKYDDSNNKPGWKYNKWEMLGVPIRIEVGPKEVKVKKVTLVRRDTRKREIISEKQLDKKISQYEKSILTNITEKADMHLRANISEAKTFAQLVSILNKKRGFVKVKFCTLEKGGEKCADKIQQATDGGKVRGSLFGDTSKVTGECVVCGKKATATTYLAKSY